MLNTVQSEAVWFSSSLVIRFSILPNLNRPFLLSLLLPLCYIQPEGSFNMMAISCKEKDAPVNTIHTYAVLRYDGSFRDRKKHFEQISLLPTLCQFWCKIIKDDCNLRKCLGTSAFHSTQMKQNGGWSERRLQNTVLKYNKYTLPSSHLFVETQLPQNNIHRSGCGVSLRYFSWSRMISGVIRVLSDIDDRLSRGIFPVEP